MIYLCRAELAVVAGQGSVGVADPHVHWGVTDLVTVTFGTLSHGGQRPSGTLSWGVTESVVLIMFIKKPPF